jgi:hypothetical protein
LPQLPTHNWKVLYNEAAPDPIRADTLPQNCVDRLQYRLAQRNLLARRIEVHRLQKGRFGYIAVRHVFDLERWSNFGRQLDLRRQLCRERSLDVPQQHQQVPLKQQRAAALYPQQQAQNKV